MTTREAAWDAVHEALPARWCVGRPSFNPGAMRGDGYRGAWSITARGPHPGRGKAPQTVSGTGEDETGALRDLDDRLRGQNEPGGRLAELRARLRLAYIQGAEGWTLEHIDRRMTVEELDRVLSRYTGPAG